MTIDPTSSNNTYTPPLDLPGDPGVNTPPPPSGSETPPPLPPPYDEDEIDAIAKRLLPLLSDPKVGGLSMEQLIQALGLENRDTLKSSGLAALKEKAAERQEASDKKIAELQKQIEELAKKEKLSPLKKAFKWLSIALQAVAAIAVTVAAVATANPLLIAGAAIMIAMTVNTIMTEASDGKISIAAGIAAAAEKLGASEETAQWIGMGVEIGISLIGAGLCVGAGGAAAAAKLSDMAGKITHIVTRIAQLGSVISGLTSVASGAVSIVEAGYDKNIADSRATQKMLEAIMERLQEALDVETKFLEAIMKRAEELLSEVGEIVDENNQAQTAILVNNPPAVA